MAAVTESDLATERTRLGGASALVAAVALVVSAGVEEPVAALQGVVAAVVVLTAWYLSAPTYAFALGNVALVAVLPETAIVRMVVVEAGLLGMLLASATTLDDSDHSADGPDHPAHLAVAGVVVLVLAWAIAGGALAWASAGDLLGLPVAGGLLIALTALVVYGLHRYQLVSLGVVSETAGGEARE